MINSNNIGVKIFCKFYRIMNIMCNHFYYPLVRWVNIASARQLPTDDKANKNYHTHRSLFIIYEVN